MSQLYHRIKNLLLLILSFILVPSVVTDSDEQSQVANGAYN